MLYIIFGLPGVGKTYVGKIFQKDFRFHFYDGDVDMSQEMHVAVQNQTPFTGEMRDTIFSRLLKSTKELMAQGSSRTYLEEVMKDHIIGRGLLTGTYSR